MNHYCIAFRRLCAIIKLSHFWFHTKCGRNKFNYIRMLFCNIYIYISAAAAAAHTQCFVRKLSRIVNSLVSLHIYLTDMWKCIQHDFLLCFVLPHNFLFSVQQLSRNPVSGGHASEQRAQRQLIHKIHAFIVSSSYCLVRYFFVYFFYFRIVNGNVRNAIYVNFGIYVTGDLCFNLHRFFFYFFVERNEMNKAEHNRIIKGSSQHLKSCMQNKKKNNVVNDT